MKILEWISTITETKHSLDRLQSRIEMTEERVHELEDRSRESVQSKQQSKKTEGKQNRRGKRELWYNIKKFNIHVLWTPEAETVGSIGMRVSDWPPGGCLSSLAGSWAPSSGEQLLPFSSQKALTSHEEAVLHCGQSQPDLASDCVTTSKLLNPPAPQFPHLNNRDSCTSVYHEPLTCTLSRLIFQQALKV